MVQDRIGWSGGSDAPPPSRSITEEPAHPGSCTASRFPAATRRRITDPQCDIFLDSSSFISSCWMILDSDQMTCSICPEISQDSLLQLFQPSPEVSEQDSDCFLSYFSLCFPPANFGLFSLSPLSVSAEQFSSQKAHPESPPGVPDVLHPACRTQIQAESSVHTDIQVLHFIRAHIFEDYIWCRDPDFNTLAELKIDIQDIHTIAADLQSIQTSVNALNETLNNNNVSKAMVCGIIGNLMSEHLSLGIQEIKRGEWPRIMNSTSLFSLIKNSDVTCKNFALAKIRSLDAACNKAQVGKQVIPLTIDIPTWITKPLPAYKMVVLGEMEVNNGTKILKQLLPQNRIIVKENQVWKTIDSNCCTRRGQAWLCSCSSERLEYVDGCAATHSGSCLVKLQKSEPGWQKIIHTYDSKVCALGVSLFAWQKRVQCQAPITGWCVNLTEGKLTIGDEVIQANILLEQLSMDIEQIDFGNWKSMISPLFKKIPPLTIELDTLFKRDSRRVIELQELVKENLISSNKISKEFQEPWWSIPYSTVTHPVLRTISMIFMIIQFVLICILFGLYCCGRRQFRTIKSTKKNFELASILTAKNV
ncbi:uncharacterized protein ACMZJ9_017759 [Mantella aurantiaca]